MIHRKAESVPRQSGFLPLTTTRSEANINKTAYVIPDVHHPYHNKSLFETSLNIVRDLKPDKVVFIGDVFDCEQISKYHHNAYKARIVQETVEFCHKDIFNPMMAAAGWCESVFICGNHENRINTFCEAYLAPLGGKDFVDVKDVLNLNFANSFIPYMSFYELCPGTMLTHGHYVRADAGASVKKHMDFVPGNLLIGHTHRIGMVSQTQVGGVKKGYEIGHMASMDTPGAKPVDNWQMSPGTIVRYSEDGKQVSVNVLEVSGGMINAEGEIYRVG